MSVSAVPAFRGKISTYRKNHSGFALLITITLLAFLVLLLVSLSSLTRVETQVASNNQQLAQARQNALMALNVALGELQRTAGPDQRVTARADLQNATPTQANWVGVYGPGNNPQDGTAVPAPQLLNWLVSRNENRVFTPSVASANFGQITPAPAGNPTVQPTDAVTGLAANPDPTVTAFTIGTGADNAAMLLVGANSTDCSTDALAQANAVVAPLVDISSSGVPGLAGSQRIGRYAWWVGDEGVKATVNLIETDIGSTDLTVVQRKAVNAERIPLEAMSGFNALTPSAANLANATDLTQLVYVDPALTTLINRSRFYDWTVSAKSVLANSREGGLKRDLTRALYDPVGSLPADVQDNSLLFTDPNGVGPGWGVIRSWANLKASAVTDTTRIPTVAAGDIRPHRDTGNSRGLPPQQGVGPVLVRAGMEFWLRCVATTATNNKFQFGVAPVFVIANPYNVKLAAKEYLLSWNTGQDGGQGFRAAIESPAKDSIMDWDVLLQNIPAGARKGFGQTGSRFPWLHFRTPAIALEPGEAVILTSSAADWAPYQAINLLTVGFNPSRRLLFGDNGVEFTNTELVAAKTAGNFIFGPNDPLTPAQEKSNTNVTVQLSLYDPAVAAATLATAMPEALARIERVRASTFVNKPGAPSWPIYFLVELNPREGIIVSTQDIGLGHEARAGAAPNLQRDAQTNYSWAKDFNFRYSYPANSTDGQANTPQPGDPGRNYALYGYARGFGGNESAITPSASGGTAYWGPDTQLPLGKKAVGLFEVLTQDLISPAQLLHVNLAARDRLIRAGNITGMSVDSTRLQAGIMQPPYCVGSSFRDPAVGAGDADLPYDWVARANNAIWDKWFVSTVPNTLAALAPFAPVNSKIKLVPDATLAGVKTIDQAAANVVQAGAFNINSTSKEAWKAVLAATRGLPSVVAQSGAGTATLEETGLTTTTRLARESVTNRRQGDDDGLQQIDARFISSVRLTDAQIDTLADQIVQRIKRKAAPFLSLAELINRPDSTRLLLAGEKTDRGLLQNALEALTSYNNTFLGATGSSYDVNRNTGAPGAPFQGDLLQAIGANLTARSDTFRIRAYGDVIDPVNSTAANPIVTSRVWCEAIVQRLPEYVNPADAPQVFPPTNVDNQTFGRRFKIVGFRWLTKNDI